MSIHELLKKKGEIMSVDIKLSEMKFLVLDTETTGPTPRTLYKIKKNLDGSNKYAKDQNGHYVIDNGKLQYEYELDEYGNKIVEKEPDKVIEYASVLFDMKTKQFSESVQMFFNPGILIPPQAMSVHHITNEMVKDKPPLDPNMLEHIKKNYLKNYVKVAYNSNFDSGIMGLDDYGIWIDAYKLAMKTWHLGEKNEDGFELSSFKQQELRYWLKLPEIEGDAHRADFDIKVTSLILDKIVEKYLEKGYEDSWKAFQIFYNSKMEYVTIPIGPTNIRGKKVGDLTYKELESICNKKNKMYESYVEWGIVDCVKSRRSKMMLEKLSSGELPIKKATRNSVNSENKPRNKQRRPKIG